MSTPILIHIYLHSIDYILELITMVWLLVRWKEKGNYARLWLGLFFAVSLAGSAMSQWVLIKNPSATLLPIMSPNPIVLSFPICYLLILYVLEYCQTEHRTQKWRIKMLLPWLIVAVPTMVVCRIEVTPLYHLSDIINHLDKPDVWMRILSLLIYLPYGIYTYAAERKSRTEYPHIRWQALLLLLMTITFVTGNGLRMWVFDVLHVAEYILVAILGIHAEFLYTPTEKDTPESQDEEACQSLTYMELPPKERIRILIEDEKVWLDPNMALNDMAQQVGTNRTYLLQMIKEMGYKNFSDMMNQHRIAYAIAEQKRQPNKALLEILYASGYKSRTSAMRNYNTYASSIQEADT